MQDQRWQCKVVDQLRFIRTIAKVGNIVEMRNVCFGNQHHTRCNYIEHRAHELNHTVSLRQMNARRSDFLPEIGDSIESNKSRTALNIGQQGIQDSHKDLRVLKV